MSVNSRWIGTVGAAAFVFSLFLYRSFERRPVLDLWSYPYAAVLTAIVGMFGLMIARRFRSASVGRSSTPQQLLDFAILSWGVAYLLSSIDDARNASRFLDLNVFGSASPIPACLEWIAMTLATFATLFWAAEKLTKTGRKTLFSFAALIFVALLGEGGLRIRAAIAPTTQGFPTHTSDQWTRRYVDLNSQGFRDVEHPISTPPNESRLLVVGDSYAFGSGINEIGDRLGNQLAVLLSNQTGDQWRSMSAALGDSDTLDEIEFLEQMRAYERNAVLLIYVFNDIDYVQSVTSRSVLTENPSGLLELLHPARVLFLNSYLFQELFVRVRLASYALKSADHGYTSPYLDDALLDRHLDDLSRFVELASVDDTPVWIAPFETAGGDPLLERYSRFEKRARARGLPILNLAQAFAGHDRTELRVNSLDRHPNELANRIAAETLAPQIVERLESHKRGM